jgi:5'-phosphate synthase pdxT subunit
MVRSKGDINNMIKIGVLGLQGAVREHMKALETSGVEVIVVKRNEELLGLDGLVMPGGESTTMRRLIDKYNMFHSLQDFAKSGKPVFGTCAGMILMAKEIEGYDKGHLEIMDMKVQRNGFGRQRESFEVALNIKGLDEEFIGVFIRAPYILEVGEGVEILASFQDKIVATRQGRYLACAFHPELIDDDRFHQYFVSMVKEAKEELQAHTK